MVDQRKRFVRDGGFELIFSRTGACDVRRSSVGRNMPILAIMRGQKSRVLDWLISCQGRVAVFAEGVEYANLPNIALDIALEGNLPRVWKPLACFGMAVRKPLYGFGATYYEFVCHRLLSLWKTVSFC